MLRILHVVDSLERGGLERVVTDLATLQHRQGWEVAVFSIKPPGGFAQELVREGVPVHLGNKRRAADPATLLALRRTLRSMRADVVHAHNFMPAYYSAAASLAMRAAPAMVVTCHDMGLRLQQRKLRWIMRWALARADRVAMVGEQVRTRYLGEHLVGATKSRSILNGVVLERGVDGPAARSAARLRLQLPDDALVIGCVGRLVELKNHRGMIDAMPTLLERFPDLYLAIVGDGALREELQAQAQRLGIAARVKLAGEQPDVTGLLPAFDVFAMPSTTEGLSIALLEAAASALPILATAVGGNVEIVQDGATGLLVPARDAPALRAGLVALLGDAPLRERLGRAAREWVVRYASIDAMFRAYDEFYQEAMGSPPARLDSTRLQSP